MHLKTIQKVWADYLYTVSWQYINKFPFRACFSI